MRVDEAGLPYAPSIAWAHAQTSADPSRTVACIGFAGQSTGGCRNVSVGDIQLRIWFVLSAEHYRGFFRWLIARLTKNPHDLRGFAPSAFPSLDFVDVFSMDQGHEQTLPGFD